jgi:AAHS family 4-hydroxybenzoate transporter-like MFS transporter
MSKAADATVEVGQLIDERPIGALQVLVVVLCALVVMIDGYDIQIMSLAVPAVAQDWGVPASSFGLVLSAALAGIGLGGAFIAPLADRIGRRPVLVATVALVGLATLAAALAHTLSQFVLWRLLTGVGMGAAQPVAVALTAEYVPARRRAWLVTVMYCNVAVGAFVAGFAAPPLMHAFGWRGLFLAGGIATVGLGAVLLAAIPESLRFLVARRPGGKGLARVLGRLAPEVSPAAVAAAAPGAARRRSVLELLGRDYRLRTLVLWLSYGLGSFALYLLITWLPTLLRQAGWPQDAASRGSVVFQLGGVAGGLLLSAMVDRGRILTALLIGYAVAGSALLLLSFTPSTYLVWGGLMLLIGAGLNGAQFVVIAVAAGVYPSGLKAAGVGWVGTVSRVGAVLAPLFGAWAIGVAGPAQVLAMMLAPVAACAALAFLIRRDWLQG